MTDAEDALDNILVWELCKQKDLQEMIVKGSGDRDENKKLLLLNTENSKHL